jgi:hypothetical protein
MKFIFKQFLLGTIVFLGCIGCSMTDAPVNGIFFNGAKGPVSASGAIKYSKTGKATCHVVNPFNFGIPSIGWGTCTIKAAKDSVGINSVAIVDSESLEILSIYGNYTLVVYGD